MKLILFLLTIILSGFVYTQNPVDSDTAILRFQEFDEFKLPRNYHQKYKQTLRRVRRVYPLALHAAYIIDSLEHELAEVDKKRVQKKITKDTHKDLKEDFKYLLKELYVSEGVVLTKLIYRETGMTVEEIIKKYKGGAQATLYTGLAAMFDQELDATYDPDGEDFILECVIRDIQSGKVEFDDTFVIVDKAHFKKDRAEYRARQRENKKFNRQLKREERKKSKESSETTQN